MPPQVHEDLSTSFHSLLVLSYATVLEEKCNESNDIFVVYLRKEGLGMTNPEKALEILKRFNGCLVPYTMLMVWVWKEEWLLRQKDDHETLRSLISKTRKILPNGWEIHNIRNHGYYLTKSRIH